MTERGRIYIRPTTADFASDEAIEDFAARLWQAFTQAEGIHMTTQLTERYALIRPKTFEPLVRFVS